MPKMWHCSHFGDERTLLMAQNWVRSTRGRAIVAASLLVLSMGAVWMIGPMPVSAAVPPPASTHNARPQVAVDQQWTATIASPAGGIDVSSPNIANLPGGQAVVVGDENGYVDAYY